MRLAVTFALALATSSAAWAVSLPGMGPRDAGKAAEFGRSLCLMSPQDVDAFTRRLDTLVPGTTTSGAFMAGQASARMTLNDLASRNEAPNELRDTTCPEVRAQFDAVAR